MNTEDNFANTDIFLKNLKTQNEDYWCLRGEAQALSLFHDMAKRVPAYKDFLKKKNFNPDTVATIEDFKNIPTIDKDNYLRSYPLEMLCWDGEFKKQSWVISATSGSTGEPFYFPRQLEQDKQYALLAELYLLTNFRIDTKSTLYIVGFPMGPWIGGVFTYQALKMIAEKGKYNLSIITPGINKQDIINTVKKFGHSFDQIIIGSYGPFLKDTLDDGERQGLNWKEYNVGFVFSAEVFSETFRDYIIEHTGIKDVYRGTLNHYGTVDLGTMAYETPISILMRRLAIEKIETYHDLFGVDTKLPTLAQYLPEQFYFESDGDDLICSAHSGIPLVRYDLKDHGGVMRFSKATDVFKKHGISLMDKAKDANITDSVWRLPFVYIYERSDFSVSFYAFQIYPETIRRAIQQPEFDTKVTGKFTMLVKSDSQQNPYLEINVELKSGIENDSKLSSELTKQVLDGLVRESSEYRKTYSEMGEKVRPHIILWPYEDSLYFKPGIKQKWVKKAL